MSLRSTGKLKLGGGGVDTLNEATILYGKGENIKELNYDNITVNPLVFTYPIIIEKKSSTVSPYLPYNELSISNDAFYYKSETIELFQKKLIRNEESGIILNDDGNISVNFSKSGWSNQSSKLYTLINNVGIGTNNPIETLHINNNNAAIIIDNNINKFKLTIID
jgi:hypothetical protein